MTKTQAAELNIKLYVFVRIFAKRVFLPLSAIYFVAVSGLTVEEIGLLGAFSAVVALVLEVPTGYFSDKFGKSYSLRIAGILNALATLIFVLVQNKTGVFLGIFLEAVGYSFLAGAGEALLHDSLEVLGKSDKYTKVSSRAQSRSLIINAILIALVPMTYAIDERLPFLVGTVAYIGLAVVGFMSRDVADPPEKRTTKRKINWSFLKQHRALIGFGLIFGLVGSLYTAPSDLQNLALVEYGLNPELLGWIFSGGSVLGAIMGYFAHYLKSMPLLYYTLIDGFMVFISIASFAIGNFWVPAAAVVISISFWRYRKIVYQDYILSKYKTRYKATVLSSFNNAERLQRVWLPLVFAWVIAQYGNTTSFAYFSVATVIVLIPFTVSVVRFLGTKKT